MSIESAYNGSLGGDFRLHADVTEASVDTANNRSLVNVTVYMRATVSGTGVYNLSATSGSINVNGTVVGETMSGYDFRSSTGPYYLVQNYQQWVTHNNDGTGSCTFSSSHDAADSPYVTTSQSLSGTLTLTTINRTASITSFTLSGVSDIGFTINASTDLTCSKIEYSLDNGSTWNAVNTSGTSWAIPLTNLLSGTTYSVKVRVTTQSSGIVTTSGTNTATTSIQNNFAATGVFM